MELIETLNRTMKLAMDEGMVGSYEEAQELFGSFRLRIRVQPGFTTVPAAEAAVLTLLNAAPRTFLGGVELVGPLDERCTRAWFTGMNLGEVAQYFGVSTNKDAIDEVPTISIGECFTIEKDFCLGVSLHSDGFTLSPDHVVIGTPNSPVEAGIAAAGAALNEAFQYIYRKSKLAGQRVIQWKFPWKIQETSMRALWMIGLGHLGQAFFWAAALAGGDFLPRSIKLSDYDMVSWSSISTCLLVNAKDVGKKKVDVVAEQLEVLGVQVKRDYERLELDSTIVRSEQDLAIVAVDNVALRRSLDRLHAIRILEAGIGDGAKAFTRIQMHAFPGPRKARDIWIEDDIRATQGVDLSKPAYQALLSKTGDECGTTLVAGRSVATPFVGAFAGAILNVLAINPRCSDYAWNFDVASL